MIGWEYQILFDYHCYDQSFSFIGGYTIWLGMLMSKINNHSSLSNSDSGYCHQSMISVGIDNDQIYIIFEV